MERDKKEKKIGHVIQMIQISFIVLVFWAFGTVKFWGNQTVAFSIQIPTLALLFPAILVWNSVDLFIRRNRKSLLIFVGSLVVILCFYFFRGLFIAFDGQIGI